MAKKASTLRLTEEQVLWFRARRGHLAGPGARSTAEASRAILGAQAQQLSTGLLALAARTRGRPTARELQAELLEPPRSLVRTWGQRDTLHLYDPRSDWTATVAARGEWAGAGRRGGMPSVAAVARTRQALAEAGAPLTRRDIDAILPASLVKAWEERLGKADARRFAAGRLFWRLVNDGHACLAGKVGAEQAYAAREHWFPELAWPERHEPAPSAALGLARRYLASYGPATAHDLAHFFGARVGNARRWLDELAPELLDVSCGERDGLVALAEDARELRRRPPGKKNEWPVRLLPAWDTALMGHADKSWLAPDEAERPLVWRKAAFVAASVIDRGRIVATWSHAAKRRRVEVAVTPLGRWRAAKHAPGVRREARALARHLGLDEARVAVEG